MTSKVKEKAPKNFALREFYLNIPVKHVNCKGKGSYLHCVQSEAANPKRRNGCDTVTYVKPGGGGPLSF